jgi:hypothetical protein
MRKNGVLLRRAILLLSMLPIVALSGGCKRLPTGAREHFSRQFSCPEDRVELIERSDVKYGDLTFPKTTAAPPDDVKSDPERLALWEKNHADEASNVREKLNEMNVFQAKGCGQDVLLACAHPSSEGGEITSEVLCHEVPLRK